MLAIIERCIGEHTGNNINSKTQQAKPASARESLPSNYWLRWRCNWTQSSQSDNFQLARFHVRLPNTNSGEKTKGSKHCQKCNLTIPQAPSLLQIQKLSSDEMVVVTIFLGDGSWHGLKAIVTLSVILKTFFVPSSPLNKKVFFFSFSSNFRLFWPTDEYIRLWKMIISRSNIVMDSRAIPHQVHLIWQIDPMMGQLV